MGVVGSKTFKSGNSVAVRLPRELGFAANVPVTIERRGDELRIVPAGRCEDEASSVERLVKALLALPPVAPEDREQRARIEFPDRPGLR